MAELAALPPPDALEVLQQFMSSGLVNIRNKSAYLHGVMGRHSRGQAGPGQKPDVQARLDHIFQSTSLSASDLDLRCYEALGSLPAHTAMRVLDKFVNRDLGDVRNICAWFMSIIKQVRLPCCLCVCITGHVAHAEILTCVMACARITCGHKWVHRMHFAKVFTCAAQLHGQPAQACIPG